MYKMFVQSTFEYGLALGMFSETELQPLQKIQNAFLSNMLHWKAPNVGAAMFGLSSVVQRSQELSAQFRSRINQMDESTLAYHVWKYAQSQPVPGSCFAQLQQNPKWQALPEDTVISAKIFKDWGCQECKKWSQAATSIFLLKPNQCVDISGMSILPQHITTVFLVWRMGVLTAGHFFCPEGHCLSCHLVMECISATN